MNMTKAERAELLSVVKMRFRVLREEVKERRAELIAGLESQITEHFKAGDDQWEAFRFDVDQAVLACNRAINDALYKHEYAVRDGSERVWVTSPPMQPPGDRHRFRIEAIARIEQQVKAALLTLDRQEADLRERLSLGVIESPEAREFLSSIPTVGELVPATRLQEIADASHDDDDD